MRFYNALNTVRMRIIIEKILLKGYTGRVVLKLAAVLICQDHNAQKGEYDTHEQPDNKTQVQDIIMYFFEYQCVKHSLFLLLLILVT
ncbi:hypothetical protein ES708_20123 [subsurface metagenome]